MRNLITALFFLLIFTTLRAQDAYSPIYRLMMEGRYVDAQVAIEKAAGENPSDYKLLTLMGDVYVQQYQYDKGVECYRKALDLSPNNPQALESLAECYRQQGLYAKAGEVALQLYQSDTTSQRYAYKLAAILQTDGKVKRAIPMLELLVAENPANVLYLRSLADCYVREKRYDKAAACYTEVLNVNPLDVTIYSGLSNIYYNTSDFVRAADYARQGLAVDSTNTQLLRMLGFSTFKENDYGEAIAAFRKAYSLGDSAKVVSKYLGISLSFYGIEIDESILHLERAYHADTTDVETLFYLAQQLNLTPRKPEAVRYIERVIELENPHLKFLSQAYEINGVIHRNMLRNKKGYELYRKAYELNPGNKLLLFSMAEAQNDLKNYEQALKLYRRYLAEINEPEEKASGAKLSIPDKARQKIKMLKKELLSQGKEF